MKLISVHNIQCLLVAWLVIICCLGILGRVQLFMNGCVLTIAMVMLLRDLGPYVFYLYAGLLEIISVKGSGVLWIHIYD
jgi:hypothetical protein